MPLQGKNLSNPNRKPLCQNIPTERRGKGLTSSKENPLIIYPMFYTHKINPPNPTTLKNSKKWNRKPLKTLNKSNPKVKSNLTFPTLSRTYLNLITNSTSKIQKHRVHFLTLKSIST